MDQLPGCKSEFRRGGICCWTISGTITSAVGFLWPIVLMAWNVIWQILAAPFFGMLSCVSGCKPCACYISKGFVCTSCCSSCLFPIGFLSEVSCGGSCAVLGTTWIKVITFAGFTGAAWYITIGNILIGIGLLCFVFALLYWANSCLLEAGEAPEPDEKPLVSDELTEIDLEANTGALKF